MFDYIAFKKYLEDNGLKQRFVAQQVKITDAVLSAILTGRTKCSLENYVTICQTLSLPFGSFIKDTPIQFS